MARLQTLGDVLGSLSYMGQCPCGAQHVSRSARVLVRGSEILCERCAVADQRAEGALADRREVRP